MTRNVCTFESIAYTTTGGRCESRSLYEAGIR